MVENEPTTGDWELKFQEPMVSFTAKVLHLWWMDLGRSEPCRPVCIVLGVEKVNNFHQILTRAPNVKSMLVSPCYSAYL